MLVAVAVAVHVAVNDHACMTRTHEFTSMRALIFPVVAVAAVARSLRTAEGVQGEMENLWRDC
jgi:hypothetical protein